jgi:16S rRNA (adenine(1408)-N(1))-methyltransferase
VAVDLGAGDGRAVLARASADPGELVVGIDASSAGMVHASRRAARPAARGGLPNARFVVAGLEALPGELSDFADLVSVHFPWGSLLAAATGDAPALTRHIVRLLRPGGTLRLVISASPRDERAGVSGLDPERIAAVYRELGMRVAASRLATHEDVEASRSSWGKRLATSPGRVIWLMELRDCRAPGYHRRTHASDRGPE